MVSKDFDREKLLADVAEMYYLEGKTQVEISDKIGMTRSAVSRLLTEARQKGIVEINVHHPLRFNDTLEDKLKENFNLAGIKVINSNKLQDYEELKTRLGNVAAGELANIIKPDMTIGISWGTSVKHAIDAFDHLEVPNIRVTQLLGVMGSSRLSYSGQSLVEDLAQKLKGKSIFLYTPFIVDSADTATLLKNDQSLKEVLSVAKQSDLAILGIGSVKPEYCSLYQGGHITLEDLETITAQNAVGDVNGHFFTIDGAYADVELHNRLIAISREDLLNIPTRLAAAGNPEKAEAILGALRSGLVNYLVTDNFTATRILELANI